MARQGSSAENEKAVETVEAAHHGDLCMFNEMAKGKSRKRRQTVDRMVSEICGKDGPLKYAKICEHLIQESNIDVNSVDVSGKTLLCVEAEYGDLDAIKFLINHGANPNVKDAKGFTPLHYAVIGAKPRAMEVLLSEGAEVEAQNFTGSPLLLATLRGDIPCIKVLLDRKANPNSLLGGVVTPLVITVMNNERCLFHPQKDTKEIAELLIKAGAKVNRIRLLGLSYHSKELTEYLLESGADPNLHDKFGRLPIEIAAMRGDREAVEILFPVTNRISKVPDWSIEGFLRYVESEDVKALWESLSEGRFLYLKERIEEALLEEEFLEALVLCNYALLENREIRSLLALRSRCWMELGNAQCSKMAALYRQNSTRDADSAKLSEDFTNVVSTDLSKCESSSLQRSDPDVYARAATSSANEGESIAKKDISED